MQHSLADVSGSWNLYCKLGFSFIASCRLLARPPLGTPALASVTHYSSIFFTYKTRYHMHDVDKFCCQLRKSSGSLGARLHRPLCGDLGPTFSWALSCFSVRNSSMAFLLSGELGCLSNAASSLPLATFPIAPVHSRRLLLWKLIPSTITTSHCLV